jgi:hypothetical protein
LRDEGFQRSLSRCGALLVEQLASSAVPDAAPEQPAQGIPFHGRVLDAGRAFLRAGAVVFTLAGTLAAATAPTESAAQALGQEAVRIKDRNIDVSRQGATELPRSEGDQALVDGWPLYRTERGQAAFNDAMATLKATDGAAPASGAFKGCEGLECNLSLPVLGSDGWIPPGRIWVSPSEYVLIVHSPRLRDGQTYRRRAYRDMRYFVFHEFHNSTRNTDPFDTISSHSGTVFVPFYMSKQWTDAKGRRFVIVLQVAPYDVVSFHATDKGSAGPGMEVAKNMSDALEPLQGHAGILVATIAKTAAPQLEVVNHGGTEGLPMLTEYQRRLQTLRARPGAPIVVMPFMPAQAQRVATATGRLGDMIVHRGESPLIPVAKRGIVPPRDEIPEPATVSVRSATLTTDPVPTLIGPIRPATRSAPRAEPTLVEPIRPATRPAALPSNGPGR